MGERSTRIFFPLLIVFLLLIGLRTFADSGSDFQAQLSSAPVSKLISTLADSDQMTRLSAHVALLQRGPSTIPELAKALHRNKNAAVRAAIARVLGDLRDTSAMPDLWQAFSEDHETNVQVSAATAMISIGPPSNMPYVCLLYTSDAADE